jgi:CubicO group peptidase (beta-lactamase class C family)
MSDVQVDGTVQPGFERVRDVFADVLAEQRGTGAAVAAWHAGSWVVDLWGGWADSGRTRPWAEDTLVMPYSVTKPFAAMPALLLADRGDLDLDAPVQEVWPEMTARTTTRQLLSHHAGLVVLDEELPREAFLDWEGLCSRLAAQQPSWEPGTASGESALFYGHLVGEVVRRVDGRTPGRYLRDEVCGPLGLDFHIGLDDGEIARVADLIGLEHIDPSAGSALHERALRNPDGAIDPAFVNSDAWRRAEVPAVNGHGTARSVAGLYVALQQGQLLSPGMLAEVVRGEGTKRDLVMDDEREWGLGVVVDEDGYGMGGLGGSFGWWSEAGQYAFGWVTGSLGHDGGDLLENSLRAVLDLPPV